MDRDEVAALVVGARSGKPVHLEDVGEVGAAPELAAGAMRTAPVHAASREQASRRDRRMRGSIAVALTPVPTQRAARARH